MHLMPSSVGIGFALMLFLGSSATPADDKAPASKVGLKIVKLDALKDHIKQQKGKVVVVDFWADT
jgi:hypothetical protein